MRYLGFFASGENNLSEQLQHNTDSGEAAIAVKPSNLFYSQLKLPLPFSPHASDIQDMKEIFLSSSHQTLTQVEILKSECLPSRSPSGPYVEKTVLQGGSCRILFLYLEGFFSHQIV